MKFQKYLSENNIVAFSAVFCGFCGEGGLDSAEFKDKSGKVLPAHFLGDCGDEMESILIDKGLEYDGLGGNATFRGKLEEDSWTLSCDVNSYQNEESEYSSSTGVITEDLASLIFSKSFVFEKVDDDGEHLKSLDFSKLVETHPESVLKIVYHDEGISIPECSAELNHAPGLKCVTKQDVLMKILQTAPIKMPNFNDEGGSGWLSINLKDFSYEHKAFAPEREEVCEKEGCLIDNNDASFILQADADILLNTPPSNSFAP